MSNSITKEQYILNLKQLKSIIDSQIRLQEGIGDFISKHTMPFGWTISNVKDIYNGDRSLWKIFVLIEEFGVDSTTYWLTDWTGIHAVTVPAQIIYQIVNIDYNKLWNDLGKICLDYRKRVIASTAEDVELAKNAININMLSKLYARLNATSSKIPNNRFDLKASQMADEAMTSIKRSWYVIGVFLTLVSLILFTIYGLCQQGTGLNFIEHIKNKDLKGFMSDVMKLGVLSILALPAVVGFIFIMAAMGGFNEESIFTKILSKLNLNLALINKFRNELDKLIASVLEKLKR
jgi:hypothetical protein